MGEGREGGGDEAGLRRAGARGSGQRGELRLDRREAGRQIVDPGVDVRHGSEERRHVGLQLREPRRLVAHLLGQQIEPVVVVRERFSRLIAKLAHLGAKLDQRLEGQVRHEGIVPLLIVHPSVPANTAQAFVALARAKPGTLNYSSAGSGTSNHLAGELLRSMTGIDIVHIPYKGSAPALNDLLAGQVSMMFDLVLTAAPHVRSGAVRGLAVTGAQRSSALPALPTVAESGVPGYEVSAWFGIFAPAGVPPAAVQRLNTEFVKALREPDLRQRLASQGAEPLTSTPDEFAAYLRSEIDKWAKVVKAAGMKPD